MKKLVVLVFFVLISVGFVDAIDISCPYTISSAGNYNLEGGENGFNGNCVVIQASNVVLGCDNIVYDADGVSDEYGIYLDPTSGTRLNNVTIKNCHFQDFEIGIFGNNVDNLTILNNKIVNTIPAHSTNGIHISNSKSVKIEGNFIKALETAVSSSGIYIFNNNMTNISKNVLEMDEALGIGIYGSDNSQVRENSIKEVDGPGSGSDNFGIWFFEPINSKVFSNSISKFKSGIRFESSSVVSNVYNNTIDLCDNGIDVIIDPDKKFTKNNFSSNYITNSNINGIYFNRGEPVGDVSGTIFYNNYFSNDLNAYSDTGNLQLISFNLDPSQTSVNIMGGTTLAGNYWSSPDKNGCSDSCTAEPDGTCFGQCNFPDNLNLFVVDFNPLAHYSELEIDVSPNEINDDIGQELTIVNTGSVFYDEYYVLILTQLSPYKQLVKHFGTDVSFALNTATYTVPANTFSADGTGLIVYVRDALILNNANYFDFEVISIIDGGIPDSCGDGDLDPGEVCDGADLDGKTCVTQGFNGGILACYPNTGTLGCTFDTSDCTNDEEEGGEEPGNGGGTTDPPIVGPNQYLVNEPCEEDGNPDDEFGTSTWTIYDFLGNTISSSGNSGTPCVLEKEKIPFFGFYSFILFSSILVIFYVFRKKQ
ncbi:right-handed parallel beta-helix repeat-containing protein [Candidatus Woesearchaeota archaeon]|nr:right-handed parallel beta-helix repeat-containing protein [Candidatus Woesearchaeota archaeon]